MRIILIGTSHGVPEPHRRCSSTLIEIGGAYYIVDMGTQTAEDLRRRGIPFEAVRAVLCTHPHGDHTDGLINFTDLCNWYFKKAEPHIILPNRELIDAMAAWLAVTGSGKPIREGIRFSVLEEGVVYKDENVTFRAIPTQHCKDSFAFLMEAEGKKVLFTGDLRHPTADFPAAAFEEETDLILCELAHFSPDDCVPVFDKTKAKRILHTHVSPRWDEELARQLRAEHPYAYGVVNDGMEILL